MKLNKKTIRLIRKAIDFARALFLVLALLFIFLAMISADGDISFCIICVIIGAICGGVSYILEKLFW